MSNTILYGRVVRDIEVRYTNQNMAIARFSIAVNRKYKSEDKKADFFNVVSFGKKAETLSQYFRINSLSITAPFMNEETAPVRR